MLLDNIKAAQLAARKNRNTVKAALLTTLITEATTGLSATLRTEGVNAVNKRLGRKEITAEQAEAEIAKLDDTFNKDWLPDDEQVLKITAKFSTNAAEAAKEHAKRASVEGVSDEVRADRTEKADAANHEVQILAEFLPKQLSESELEEIISNFRAANPGVNMGQIMAHLVGNYKGLYDGKLASTLAKRPVE